MTPQRYREDEQDLAAAIRVGLKRRPEQAFGDYFLGRRQSCALGAAYEGLYRLPTDGPHANARELERFFDCLEHSCGTAPRAAASASRSAR